MMKKLITIILTFIFVINVGNSAFATHRHYRHHYHRQGIAPTVTEPAQSVQIASSVSTAGSPTVEQELRLLRAQAPHLNVDALRFGLKAYYHAREMGLDTKQLLTIIDYTAASFTPRLYVFNMNNNRVEYNTLVAHGAGSGDGQHAWRFSNYKGSEESSLGVFLTGSIYRGHNGTSMELDGLENGVNSNARSRRIVMHGATYVNNEIAYYRGVIGRSWGCPALSPAVAPKVINRIKEGTLIFAYYPDSHWLRNSRFLT